MSDSLFPHELQHARLPCPSLSPKTCSNSCSLSWWCHPSILSSVIPFSSCPPSSPASVSFPISQRFTSGGQSIGSFSFSISSSDEYSGLICFRIDWSDLLAVFCIGVQPINKQCCDIFKVNSEGTQPYIYMYPFSPKLPSHPGSHITLHRVPCAIQGSIQGPCWLSMPLLFWDNFSSSWWKRRTSYTIYVVQCKVKMQDCLFKIIKTSKTATQSCEKKGALCMQAHEAGSG